MFFFISFPAGCGRHTQPPTGPASWSVTLENNIAGTAILLRGWPVERPMAATYGALSFMQVEYLDPEQMALPPSWHSPPALAYYVMKLRFQLLNCSIRVPGAIKPVTLTQSLDFGHAKRGVSPAPPGIPQQKVIVGGLSYHGPGSWRANNSYTTYH